jgi:hypothetical protein
MMVLLGETSPLFLPLEARGGDALHQVFLGQGQYVGDCALYPVPFLPSS